MSEVAKGTVLGRAPRGPAIGVATFPWTARKLARPLVKERSNYTIGDLGKSEFKEDLGAGLEVYNKIWEGIRMGN